LLTIVGAHNKKLYRRSVSCALFSPSEILNDIGRFLGACRECRVFFGGDSSPVRVSIPLFHLTCLGSKGIARGGGRVSFERSWGFKASDEPWNQCARDRTDSERLVFGEDIDMDRVVEFSELAVVGRARGKRLGTTFLRSWMEKSWGSNLSAPSLAFRLLAKGWFAFVFTASLMSLGFFPKLGVWSDTPIVLKRWTPGFDAKRERVDVVPVWVRLPGLPMQYWNPVRFSAIGNKLGEYIDVDFSFEDTGLMSMARILVRLDLRPGLLKELTIEMTSAPSYNLWIMKAFLSDAIDAMLMGMG
jgi:hypothetical protein